MDPSNLDTVLSRGETQNVEIKGACEFKADMRPHLTTTIGAMANTHNGGTIVVGVENGTWVVQGLTREQIDSFDTTKMALYLKERLAPLPHFTIEHVAHQRGTVLLIQVPEFDEIPIVVTRQIEDSNHKVYAREGDMLVRSRTRECRRIASADEMRDLLSRAVTRRSEALLTQIRAIITGTAPTAPATPPEDLFAAALPEWTSAVDDLRKQRPTCAWWEVNLLPIPPLVKPLEPPSLIKLIDASAVRLRGWYYPTYGVSNQDFGHKQHFAEFAYDGRTQRERWQVNYSGAFGSAQIMHGDLLDDLDPNRHPPAPTRLVDYIDICWTVTEFFRFATSFAEGLGCEGLWVRVALHNVKSRSLGAFDPQYDFLWDSGESRMEDVVQTHLFTTSNLASAWRELALDWTKEILTVFQWPEASREALAAHQQRLIERRW